MKRPSLYQSQLLQDFPRQWSVTREDTTKPGDSRHSGVIIGTRAGHETEPVILAEVVSMGDFTHDGTWAVHLGMAMSLLLDEFDNEHFANDSAHEIPGKIYLRAKVQTTGSMSSSNEATTQRHSVVAFMARVK